MQRLKQNQRCKEQKTEHILHLTICLSIVLFWFMPLVTTYANRIIYVDDDATGDNDGTSWENAYTFLQDALTAAFTGDEIRVATGLYRPDQGQTVSPGYRQATFKLQTGVILYGGFPSGGGTWENRDPNTFVTVLSGDLLGNDDDPNQIDLLEDPSRQDNSLHVITGQGAEASAVLNGFTVHGGNANIDNSDEDGAGMYNNQGSPTVSNCIFRENSCLDEGGAIYNFRNSSLITNCQFKANVAGFGGAGVYCGSNSHINITHCLFERNTALNGAGISVHMSGTLTLHYCVIQSNDARYSGGGIYTISDYTQITNCVMIDNNARFGGAVAASNSSAATLNHCTITQNTATNSGGGIDFRYANQILMTNSIVWGNVDSSGLSRQAQLNYSDLSDSLLSYSCIQFFEEIDAVHLFGLGNIGSDPLLADDGFHLTEGSPCINAADPNVSTGLETDIDGQARVQMDRADIGADESPYAGDPPVSEPGNTFFVDQGAAGTQDGSSWTNAFHFLQDALQATHRGDQVWIAEGSYRPDQGQDMSSGDREATFTLLPGVAIYGGFPSGGGLWEERDPNTFITILSGDLLDNDGDPNQIDLIEDASRQDNSFHVITTDQWVDTDTILDGFIVQAGNANIPDKRGNGAGLYNDSGSPIVINCIFLENSCIANGGAIYSVDSNCLITDCILKTNVARNEGGGLYCRGNNYSRIIRSLFENNIADSGAGISISQGNVTVSHSIFRENYANDKGGGIQSSPHDEAILLENCVFIDNHADYGGGAHLSNNVILNHCTMVRNTANIQSGGIYIRASGSIQMTNSIIWGNVEADAITRKAQLDWRYLDQSDLRNCCLQFWTERSIGHLAGHLTGQGNIGSDPLLAADGFHLTLGSPCINAADPNISSTIETDIDGQARVQFGRSDIGADEYLYTGPIADAGTDISRRDLNDVTLDGTGSWDPWGHELQYTWYQIEGPSVILEQSDTCCPYFKPTEPNIYSFELIVNNGSVDSKPDIVRVMAGSNQAPVALVESHRYVGSQFMLDGSSSYDPDGFGDLSYYWQQISGPAAFIADANAPTPMITVTQNNSIQQCLFSLIVTDGDLISNEALQDITVVPRWDPTRNTLTVSHFDPNKPTIISFGGGDCSVGHAGTVSGLQWDENCNNLDLGDIYYVNSYKAYGDILMVFLSTYAPDYRQLIQTAGFSTGGLPAFDIAIYMNQTYADPRYAVNRVTMLDAACADYASRIKEFYDSVVPGEICWVENYSASSSILTGVLNVHFKTNPSPVHETPREWYSDSIDSSIWETDIFNHGMTAGAFISIIGPARNLQLGPDATYVFQWVGQRDGNTFYPGEIEMAYPEQYPARLPEPVTLTGPQDGTVVDANGVVLGCEVSENAVSYQLLLGDNPDNMTILLSDTNVPPVEHVVSLPFDKTYWTIKVSDAYGTTIYADPRYLRADVVESEKIAHGQH
jgi:predicted outer membrane repeat protein